MANTTYEEERKRPEVQMPQTYDYAAPQGTYYGEQGNAQSDMAEEILRRAAEQADPQRQAEEDARIQRGRNFWTGANLFANVLANAINVNGTAKGAPNMTWNDAASQKMYDTWRTADQQLKADRKAAQQRFDALRMQDAQMRAAGAEKRAAEAKAAFDINFQNEQAYQKAQNDAAQRDFEYERKKADEEAAREQAKQDRIDFYDYQRRHPMPSRRGGGGGRGSSNATKDNGGKYNISLGGITVQAGSNGDRDNFYEYLYDDMVGYLNEHPEALGNVSLPENKALRKKFVEKYFEKLYTENEDFRNGINDYYGDAVSYDGELGGAPQGNAGGASAPSEIPTVTEDRLKPSWMQNVERIGREAEGRINARKKGSAGGGFGKGPVQTMPWSEEFTKELNDRGVKTVTQQPDWKKAKKEMEDGWGLNDI